MWIQVVVRPLAIKNKIYIIKDGQFCIKGEGAGVPSKEEKTSCSLKGNIISNRGAGESPSVQPGPETSLIHYGFE